MAKKDKISEAIPAQETTPAPTVSEVAAISSSVGVASVSTTEPEPMMQISKKDFETLISTIKKNQDDIKLLYNVADQGRLARVNSAANGESLIKIVKVNKWPDNNLIIMGWKLINNQSEIINGRWIEKQDTRLVFEDGSILEVSLLDFYRKITRDKAEIVSRRNDISEEGVETQTLKLRLGDGKIIEIGSAYIN